jgi:acetyl-CoA acetyltransferase
MVVDPLRRLMFSTTTDHAGAIVVTSLERARDLTDRPVVLLGGGEAYETEMVSQLDTPCAPRSLSSSARRAFGEAGIGPGDIGHVMVFDGFAHGVLHGLEAMGFAETGGAANLVNSMRTAPGGSLPTNTNGGFLSYRHGEMPQLIESIRQLRGEAAAQVEGVSTSIVQAVGPGFSSATTVILGRADR